jgi:hypothetical protein
MDGEPSNRDVIDKQNRYSEAKARDSNLNLFVPEAFVRGIRHIGYKNGGHGVAAVDPTPIAQMMPVTLLTEQLMALRLAHRPLTCRGAANHRPAAGLFRDRICRLARSETRIDVLVRIPCGYVEALLPQLAFSSRDEDDADDDLLADDSRNAPPKLNHMKKNIRF